MLNDTIPPKVGHCSEDTALSGEGAAERRIAIPLTLSNLLTLDVVHLL